MKKYWHLNVLLAACALAAGIGVSLSAFARPCCSNCADEDFHCLSICSPGC